MLVVHAKKFQLVNWVPSKLGEFCLDSLTFTNTDECADIPIILPEDDIIVLDEYVGRGLQPGEEELPNDEAGMRINWEDVGISR